MKAIKALVVFMGILLLAGLGLLGYGVATQTGKKSRPAATAAAPSAPSAAAFGAVNVPVPAGARVEQTLVVGERVVLRLTGGGGERFVVLDPAEGTVSGSFVLSPEPPSR
jgi:hypothetical protein